MLVSGGPSTSDDDGQLAGLSAFLDTLRNVERIEVLPYHTFGVHKWDLLGIHGKIQDQPGRAADCHILHPLCFCHNNVERIEVLPYHTFGVHKWDLLGIPYPYADAVPPTQERIENAKQILGYYKRK